MQQLLLVAWEVAEVNSTQQNSNNNNNNKRRITRRGICIKISCTTHVLSYHPPPQHCSLFKSETTSARRLRGMVVEQSPRGPQGGGIRASVRRRAGLLIFSRDPASKLGPHPRPHHPPRHHHPAHPLHTDQFLTPSPSPSELHTLHARPPPSLPLTPIHLLASHLRHTSGSSFLYIHPSSIGAIGSKSGRLSSTASVRKDDNTATAAEQADDGGIPPYMKEARRRASSMQVCALIYNSYTVR